MNGTLQLFFNKICSDDQSHPRSFPKRVEHYEYFQPLELYGQKCEFFLSHEETSVYTAFKILIRFIRIYFKEPTLSELPSVINDLG